MLHKILNLLQKTKKIAVIEIKRKSKLTDLTKNTFNNIVFDVTVSFN